jgi:hypothetical protein
MKRIYAAIVAVLLVAALGVAISGGTATAGVTAHTSSIVPREGHYEGRDSHHNHIRFYYTRRGHMEHFRVNHFTIGGAMVQGAQWHHTCHKDIHGYQLGCTRGEWKVNPHGGPPGEYVEGFWNDPNQGSANSFYAHWVTAWSG